MVFRMFLMDHGDTFKEELHSVERHANLHIYFTQNPLPDGLY